MKQILTLIFCFISFLSYSQDTTLLKVHFLYGSKLLKSDKSTEQKWFGGILGGHVGIEVGEDKVLNFLPSRESFHWFANKKDKHSTYAIHSVPSFYAIFGEHPDSVQLAIIYIPISIQQKETFDSIVSAYIGHAPYDYAFFCMRCGAATYDILAQLDILKHYSYRKTSREIFYLRKLRKRLFRMAKENNWKIIKQEDIKRRKWERD
ncbi:hypothetical protein ACE193_10850 [Bernardetia sp. OM2101]|uniref:hypothetical protein n=1 Tax=Bernardetia sp. OM2101 TaxID=3344876 RepID=UPI0035CF8D6E